jgi:uracil phosphoribosyltransferase
MIHILGNETSIFNEYIAEIRDEQIQSDRMRFRRNLERMGEIFAYEISKKLPFVVEEVVTSLGVAKVPKMAEQPVVATILRAGLPLHLGMLNYFDQADNAFVSAYRKHHKDGTFEVQVEYLASPDLDDRILIICDPMLATGTSMVLAYNALLKKGKPKHTHIVSVIASTEGVTYAKLHLPENVTLWMGAVDDELTAQSYIVPGLGDAGDLAYGIKS